jgi:hypothetical protein
MSIDAVELTMNVITTEAAVNEVGPTGPAGPSWETHASYTRAAPQTVANGGTIVIGTATKAKVFVKSSGGAVTALLPSGAFDNQEILLVFCSDTDTVALVDSANKNLPGDFLGSNLRWWHGLWDSGSAEWDEIGRDLR